MSRYQFGPFDLDAEVGELRKHGIRIRIQKQPLQILQTLVERSGAVVSREDLQQTIWADGTFVDFEHGLNAGVNKVRRALGDSSDRALYIETVPGQGYRFVAAIEKLPGPQQQYPEQPGEPVAVEPTVTTGARRWNVRVTAGAAALVLCAIGSYFYFQRTPKLTDKDTIVIADFTNATGNPEFDDMLREALAIQLEESPFLKVLDDDEVYRDLQLMGQPQGARVTNEVAREICQRENQKAMISGAIGSMGKSFSITLQAINCQTGDTLARLQAAAPDREHALDTVAAAAKKMREKLGESLGSIEKLEPAGDHDHVTTPSLAAFRNFALGAAQYRQGHYVSAIPLLQRALDLDPKFAFAWLYLSMSYHAAGDRSHYAEGLKRAFDLRDQISERERLFVSSLYYYYVMQDWQKTRETAEILTRLYPRDAIPHNTLGLAYMQQGSIDDALREYLQSNEMGGTAIVKSNLTTALVRLDRFDEARVFIQKELARNSDHIGLHAIALQIALMRGDGPAEQTELDWFSGKPAAYLGIEIEAANRLVLGQRRRQRELLRQADELRAQRSLTKSSAAWTDEDAVAGICASTLRVNVPSPVALAHCGQAPQIAKAIKGVEDAARSRPFDMRVTAMDLPLTRAAGSLAQNRPETAIEQLRSMDQIERIHPEPIYLRGLAYLRLRKGEEAAAEFQKIIDHKGAYWGPFYSVSFVGLARSAALAGDMPRSKRAYQDFLTLWKDADADLPILKQAKVEYSKQP
jgi:DNA-binding winged helix-turn-helix (wHTH) protein/tetratricopeptide (TPR) repeat protein